MGQTISQAVARIGDMTSTYQGLMTSFVTRPFDSR